VRVVGEFGGKPGPAASGRAGYQDHTAASVLRLRPQSAQAGKDLIAAGENRPGPAQPGRRVRRAGRARVRCRQPRILREHGRLHSAQLRAWLHPDFPDEVTAGPLKGEQRVALPPAAVQREHQQRPQPLPQRMLAHQRLQLGGHLGVPAQRQVGLDPGLQRGQAHLPQVSRRRGAEQGVLKIRVRRPPPQRQRGAQRHRGDVGRALGRGLARPRHQISELQRINVIAGGAKHIPGALPRHGAVRAVRCQHLAHPHDIHLHRSSGAGRRVGPP